MSRSYIPVLTIEFEEGGNTLWIQGLEGTVLRLKTTGKITSKKCLSSPVHLHESHVDVMVEGDLEICLGSRPDLISEYLDKVNVLVLDMLKTKSG